MKNLLHKIDDNSSLSAEDYNKIYEYSINNSDEFWLEMAKRIDWIKFPSIIQNTSFKEPVNIKWYEDGILNACYNAVDRHAEANPEKTALLCEGNDAETSANITYGMLKDNVSKLANALKARGVKKGDRVVIYMPMILQATMAMLACARIGAVHCVVFGGFSATSLKDRITDCQANIVLTADAAIRGHKIIPLKANVDEAIAGIDSIHTVMVFRHANIDVAWQEKDIDWGSFVKEQSADCPIEPMNAEDMLFILYTSGSTGKPKGITHTIGGYLVYTSLTFRVVFDYKEGDIFWCTADIGWITGHSYAVYGALLNGATSVLFEGVPNYPDASRFWQVIDKYQVSLFYTAPTAIRALLAQGDEYVHNTSRSSLRVLGSVGEPINHEAWNWYYNVVGNNKCPIVDTWWQTETGGHLLSPLPSFKLKPGSAMKPFFGIKPVLINSEGKAIDGKIEGEGKLCIADSWPSQMRGIFGDKERFENTYFKEATGYYFSGDGAKRDKQGDYWITGRVDDVLNVSGHRLGTAEIEDALNKHSKVAESAVVGIPHHIKGEAIYAYILLKNNVDNTQDLCQELTKLVKHNIGSIACPEGYLITDDLPKTRSGKIMRRILRKIADNQFENLGDVSTLSNPKSVDDLIKAKKCVNNQNNQNLTEAI